MDEILRILKEIKPDVNFENENALIEDAILDSFDIVSIVTQLKTTFDIKISPKDVMPENFNSAKAMWEMVQKLQD